MNNNISKKRWLKIRFSLCLVLLVLIAIQPMTVNSAKLDQDTGLYDCAINYQRVNDYVQAGICLDAYKRANPPEYANDPNLKRIIDLQLATYSTITRSAVGFYNSEIYKCGKFPCNQASSAGSPSITTLPVLPPPSNAIMVCTAPNFGGFCKVLYVGRYENLANMNLDNLVVSVMVGSQVKVTLYANAMFSSQSKTLTTSDPDLGNDRLDNSSYWKNKTSSVIVQPK